MAEPLTPRTLEALGIPQPFPEPDPMFKPDGDWTATYRIWGGHGWIDCCYKTLGLLRLERRADVHGSRVQVEQKIVLEGGIIHTIGAQAQLASDAIGSLREWRVRSEVTTTSGEPDPRLCLEYSGHVSDDGSSWYETIDGVEASTHKHSLSAPLTSDWCLFEAVQRLPSTPVGDVRFDLLEGLTMHKHGYSLHYREKPEDGLQQQGLPLHRFYAIGHGLLPIDYWVDGCHRLTMAISGSRVYVRDDEAEELFQATLQQQREGRGFHE
jgi:hypothetical protein